VIKDFVQIFFVNNRTGAYLSSFRGDESTQRNKDFRETSTYNKTPTSIRGFVVFTDLLLLLDSSHLRSLLLHRDKVLFHFYQDVLLVSFPLDDKKESGNK
jgi:hypothetical protein